MLCVCLAYIAAPSTRLLQAQVLQHGKCHTRRPSFHTGLRVLSNYISLQQQHVTLAQAIVRQTRNGRISTLALEVFGASQILQEMCVASLDVHAHPEMKPFTGHQVDAPLCTWASLQASRNESGATETL